jgi:hypothetical protein
VVLAIHCEHQRIVPWQAARHTAGVRPHTAEHPDLRSCVAGSRERGRPGGQGKHDITNAPDKSTTVCHAMRLPVGGTHHKEQEARMALVDLNPDPPTKHTSIQDLPHVHGPNCSHCHAAPQAGCAAAGVLPLRGLPPPAMLQFCPAAVTPHRAAPSPPAAPAELQIRPPGVPAARRAHPPPPELRRAPPGQCRAAAGAPLHKSVHWRPPAQECLPGSTSTRGGQLGGKGFGGARG